MLELQHISKNFGGVKALRDVSLRLYPGKVNAIIGENGAGKSTLMKILSGVHTSYEGKILQEGKELQFAHTKDAEKAGIAIIHQELNLVPGLSVAENIFLGREKVNAAGVLRGNQMDTEAGLLLKKLNLDINPRTRVADLKVGQQQLVEIARALYTEAQVIIMDEPTSAISDKEVEQLFAIIGQLRSAGKTVVYISHKLKELFRIADCYTILRDGQTVDAGDMASVTPDQLVQKMTGRNLGVEKKGKDLNDKEVVLSVEGLGLRNPNRHLPALLSGISFQLHRGEILGLYGLMGAGRTELLESIFGLHSRNVSGKIKVNGKQASIHRPADAIAAGIALVPEDRKRHGLVLHQRIRSNISITVLPQLEKWGILLDTNREKSLVKKYVDRLGIKTSSDLAAAQSLSGGNQQKIVLAKWLATHPKILLLDEPTRGIDIAAKAEIYKLMQGLAAEGMSILMVSSELPEILAVSDRILVMCAGECTASIPAGEATEAGILKYALQKEAMTAG